MSRKPQASQNGAADFNSEARWLEFAVGSVNLNCTVRRTVCESFARVLRPVAGNWPQEMLERFALRWNRKPLAPQALDAFSRRRRLSYPSPKRASAAASAADGERLEVNRMRAGLPGASPAFGPLKSAARRAIAGAGSTKVTGQGASRSKR